MGHASFKPIVYKQIPQTHWCDCGAVHTRGGDRGMQRSDLKHMASSYVHMSPRVSSEATSLHGRRVGSHRSPPKGEGDDNQHAGGRIQHGLSPTSWHGSPCQQILVWRSYDVAHHEVEWSSRLSLLDQMVFGVTPGQELSCQVAGPVPPPVWVGNSAL